MAETTDYSKNKPKQSIFGGNLFLKLVFIIGLILIIAITILTFLGKIDPTKILFWFIGLIIGGTILYLAFRGLVAMLKPKPFSPTEDWRTKVIRICIKGKPFNVYNFFLRGEDMRTQAKWGKIIGLGYIPYLSQSPKKDAEGKLIIKKNKEGKELFITKNIGGKEEKIPMYDYDLIDEKDGDVVIITNRFSFPISLFKREVDIIRCNPKFLSDLIGDIYLKDVNLVPYGEYLYPAKQWQNDIFRILKQHEMETVIMTHRQWLDLASNVTQISLGSSPEFQKIMLVQSERLSNVGSGMQ